jgi:uncharacterized metal-binding protein YceD (DUF177 family)
MSAEPAGLPAHNVHVGTLPTSGLQVRLAASQTECAAIARACGVSSVVAAGAELTFRRWRAGGVQVTGKVKARVVQPCVVTLEPVEQAIEEDVRLLFIPERSRLSRIDGSASSELVLDPEGEDIPDSFSGDVIDIWPPVIEQIILAIDPFPRKPDASVDERYAAGPQDGETGERESPFAALGRLKPPKAGDA